MILFDRLLANRAAFRLVKKEVAIPARQLITHVSNCDRWENGGKNRNGRSELAIINRWFNGEQENQLVASELIEFCGRLPLKIDISHLKVLDLRYTSLHSILDGMPPKFGLAISLGIMSYLLGNFLLLPCLNRNTTKSAFGHFSQVYGKLTKARKFLFAENTRCGFGRSRAEKSIWRVHTTRVVQTSRQGIFFLLLCGHAGGFS
jgi:hypothetical protein